MVAIQLLWEMSKGYAVVWLTRTRVSVWFCSHQSFEYLNHHILCRSTLFKSVLVIFFVSLLVIFQKRANDFRNSQMHMNAMGCCGVTTRISSSRQMLVLRLIFRQKLLYGHAVERTENMNLLPKVFFGETVAPRRALKETVSIFVAITCMFLFRYLNFFRL